MASTILLNRRLQEGFIRAILPGAGPDSKSACDAAVTRRLAPRTQTRSGRQIQAAAAEGNT